MSRSVFAGLVLLAALGCGPKYIEGTEIEATEENREIFQTVELYRSAVERRDVEALKGLVSRKYFENGSTTDDSRDDYGAEGVEQRLLPKLRDNVRKVEYRVLLKRIAVDGDRAVAEYEYFWKFMFSEGGRDYWQQKNDFNRLEFAREDGVWRIVAGL
jgi:hypothetical protein